MAKITIMPSDPLSDEALIEAYWQGETDALNTLFKRYLEPIRFFLLKHTGATGGATHRGREGLS